MDFCVINYLFCFFLFLFISQFFCFLIKFHFVCWSFYLLQDSFQSREYSSDIWTYLHHNRAALTNPLYMDPLKDDTPTTPSLIPALSQLLRNVTLWTDFFYRYCPLTSIITPPSQLSQYLYDSGM